MANNEAIGLIETKGIVAAVEACDAALKAANVQFVEQHMDTVVVRLPPAVAIADSEEKLSKPGATYPLPPFYKRLFNGMDPVIPESEKFKVHAERIGDYTISACA